MFEKTVHFFKYNNAAIVIAVVVFLLGASVFASEPGREAIGQKTTRIEGVDNTLLLASDPDKLKPAFKIEGIEQDDTYYYVKYTYIDLVQASSTWEYQLTENTKKVPLSLKEDLGVYLVGEFKEEEDAMRERVRTEKEKALAKGPEKRQEVTEYSGLIGKTLELGSSIFPGYEPVKKVDLPSPDFTNDYLPPDASGISVGGSDNIAAIYQDYISTHDLPLIDNPSDASSTLVQTSDATSTSVVNINDVSASGTVEIVK